jgi:NADP-dependent aldehyde dehydrogenase
MFVAAIVNELEQIKPASMLNARIKKNFLDKVSYLSPALQVVFSGKSYLQEEQGCLVLPSLFKIDAATFLAQANLSDEVFGPSAIIVECRSTDEMLAIASQLEGQLTATVHADLNEEKVCKELFFILEKKAGRLLLNDFPTGVEVCSAMNHGGPYPATTDSRWTSVGSAAMNRFLRPICYQNFTQSLLPEELKDRPAENWNLVDTIMARIGI